MVRIVAGGRYGYYRSRNPECHEHAYIQPKVPSGEACGFNLMNFGAPGWKEAVFAVVVILALYVGLALIRLLQPRTAETRTEMPPAPDQTLLRGLQTELVGLRAQMEALQAACDGLRDDVDQLKASRAVSPQYNDALSLAQRGGHAEDIAEACGISIGEAELVCALARSRGGADA